VRGSIPTKRRPASRVPGAEPRGTRSSSQLCSFTPHFLVPIACIPSRESRRRADRHCHTVAGSSEALGPGMVSSRARPSGRWRLAATRVGARRHCGPRSGGQTFRRRRRPTVVDSQPPPWIVISIRHRKPVTIPSSSSVRTLTAYYSATAPTCSGGPPRCTLPTCDYSIVNDYNRPQRSAPRSSLTRRPDHRCQRHNRVQPGNTNTANSSV
jgi:hypothetical protein